MRILVVDDEPAVRTALHRILEGAGFDVDLASDGRQALTSVASKPPHAVILDVLMPDLDGVEVCRRMRADGHALPILMLTARSDVPDRVEGLEAGADDYLVKPFALEELLARVRALLRRSSPRSDGEPLEYAGLMLDPGAHRVRRGARDMELTHTEFSLLELFMTTPGRVLTRAEIFESVWGYDLGYASNSLEVYIGHLRRKTEAGGEARLIQTVRGVGYVLREE